MMKQVMNRAWEIAKAGVAKFGGKAREYFAVSLSIAWKEIKEMTNKKAEIRFPYCKKHWVAKISGANVQYKLARDFLDPEEVGNDIVYGELEDGYYQMSRFGKTGDYLKIENGEITEVEEKEVMNFFNAPKRGVSSTTIERKTKRDDMRDLAAPWFIEVL